MKRQSPTQAKNEVKLSDAILAKRYLELQKLRDEVRKAEIGGMMDAPCSREPNQAVHTPLSLRNRPQQGRAIENISQIGDTPGKMAPNVRASAP
jgi:hypothetical protein